MIKIVSQNKTVTYRVSGKTNTQSQQKPLSSMQNETQNVNVSGKTFVNNEVDIGNNFLPYFDHLRLWIALLGMQRF